MDKYTKWVLAILSIQLTIAGVEISRLCYKLGYEQGRSSVVFDDGNIKEDGTCYVPGGCGTNEVLQPKHHKVKR